MKGFLSLIARDTRLAFRAGGGAFEALSFFALITVLFALSAGPDPALLRQYAGPVLWTAALLATQISLEGLYRPDREDGSLDALIETSEFAAVIALAKAAGHFLSTGITLLVAAPVLGVLLNLPPNAYGPLMASLALGLPGLSLIGGFAGALTASLPRAGLLIALIVGPLYAPFLIFGSEAVATGASQSPQFPANLMLLGAASLFAAILSPLASAAALRSNLG